MEQSGCHRTDFDEIRYLPFDRKSVEKIQVLLKPEKIIETLYGDPSAFVICR
jgi:hypothetical protein